MSAAASEPSDELTWHLARGLGRGLDLLRAAPPEEARRAVAHVCTAETRWDPEREERGHYLAKALAIVGDAEIERQVLDRWERGIALRFRGPWSDVGLILAGLGRPRAIALATEESRMEEEEEGPGRPAHPEGIVDVKEWLEAIRGDQRLRIGGGLRLAQLARTEDMPELVRALENPACPHLQEAVAVALTRARDDRARDWLVARLEEDADCERAYWWWQGLSGQRPVPRARGLAIRAVDTVRPVLLQWVELTLFRNLEPGDGDLHVRLLERALREGAEDAVSVGLDWIESRWDPAYSPLVRRVLRTSAYGRNRTAALERLAARRLEVPEEDLLHLLEDAELECRTLALAQLPRETAIRRLLALGANEAEDPGFLVAVRDVFRTE